MREIVIVLALVAGWIGWGLAEVKPDPQSPVVKCGGTVDPHGNCKP